MRELIVLGNGADLACGLRSKYRDFFRYRFNEIVKNNEYKLGKQNDVFEQAKEYFDENINSLVKGAINGSRNFWDILFLSKNSDVTGNDYDWCNIESIIKNTTTDALHNDQYTWLKNLSSKYSIVINELVAQKWSKRTIITFLLNELKDFESSFAEYIRGEKIRSAEYQNEFSKMLKEISDLSSYFSNSAFAEAEFAEETVLSFNYSTSDDDNYVNNPNIREWINIHGYVGVNNSLSNSNYEKPIFGIDSSDISENDPRIPFTKTFRVATEINNHLKPLPPKVDALVFYGHSLSEADYSYFEALFDLYNIYSSKVILCFYYGTYCISNVLDAEKRRKREMLNNQLCKEITINIYNLLAHYGRSLRENHGENLFHRLLLEGRIHIIPREGDRK